MLSPTRRPKASNKPLPLSRRMDQAFEQIIQESGLGWSAQQALGLMALTGVVLAGFLLLWRGDLWTVALGLIAGLALPLLVYATLRRRWRQRLQNQLPDAFFLLARSLRAGETLGELLGRLGVSLDARGVAVAVDGEVVPRAAWHSFVLVGGARVEVLAAMQGG